MYNHAFVSAFLKLICG